VSKDISCDLFISLDMLLLKCQFETQFNTLKKLTTLG